MRTCSLWWSRERLTQVLQVFFRSRGKHLLKFNTIIHELQAPKRISGNERTNGVPTLVVTTSQHNAATWQQVYTRNNGSLRNSGVFGLMTV